MVKLIHVLSAACAVYMLFILVLVVRNFVGFVSSPYIGRAPFFVAAVTFVILGTLSVGIPALLSYLLAVRRHWDRGAVSRGHHLHRVSHRHYFRSRHHL